MTWSHFEVDELVQRVRAKAVADERQAILDEIYRKFIGGASGDGTAIDIIEIIRKRSES
jgi:hypothetical protein